MGRVCEDFFDIGHVSNATHLQPLSELDQVLMQMASADDVPIGSQCDSDGDNGSIRTSIWTDPNASLETQVYIALAGRTLASADEDASRYRALQRCISARRHPESDGRNVPLSPE